MMCKMRKGQLSPAPSSIASKILTGLISEKSLRHLFFFFITFSMSSLNLTKPLDRYTDMRCLSSLTSPTNLWISNTYYPVFPRLLDAL
jgi:hypothetical protein